MGGTFDPIHHGHLVAASEVADTFALDEVVFVPTGQPWQKSDQVVSAAEDRYLMTVIATASNPRFTVSRVDIDRDGPTYAVDTLRDLSAKFGDKADLFFITGADVLAKILSWKDADQLFGLAQFIGVTRPGLPAVRRPSARRRIGQFGARARDGYLVDRLPQPCRRRPADLVPGARWCGAVHHQTSPLSPADGAGNVRP